MTALMCSADVNYFVQDPKHPDAPTLCKGESLDYFDVTTRFFASAGTVDHPSYGKIPFVGSMIISSRNVVGEYTLRNSFLGSNQEASMSHARTKEPRASFSVILKLSASSITAKKGIRHQTKALIAAQHLGRS